jgi:hypothetical protein
MCEHISYLSFADYVYEKHQDLIAIKSQLILFDVDSFPESCDFLFDDGRDLAENA